MSLKFEQILGQTFVSKQLFLNILSGMKNNEDPDQTAPKGTVQSGSTLFAYAMFSETLEYILD